MIRAAGDHADPVRRALTQLLDDEERRQSDPLEIRKTRGVQAYMYLQALASQPVHLPTYWTARHSADTLHGCGNGKPVDLIEGYCFAVRAVFHLKPHLELALLPFSQFSAAVVRHKAKQTTG